MRAEREVSPRVRPGAVKSNQATDDFGSKIAATADHLGDRGPSPHWEPTDAADLLTLVADTRRPVGRDAPALFLAACEADARAHGGLVSVNRVRERLAAEDIPPRRFSALWSHFTGRDRPMVKTGGWEVCSGSTSGNDGRPYPVRRWVR
jgi:hypothetical protein